MPTPTHATRSWIDVPALIGQGANPDLDFRLAVHLTIYWAQDMSGGPICKPVYPPKRLAEKLRKGLPLGSDEIAVLGEGVWPPTESAVHLTELPKHVSLTSVKKGRVAWTLFDDSLLLRKEVDVGAYTYVSDIKITAGDRVRLRQTVAHVGERAPVAGVPRNLKLISAVCGLYDGDFRMLPIPTVVHTPEDVETFLKLVLSQERMQPIIAVAMANMEAEDRWRSDLDASARESFALQHIVGITTEGVSHVREMLGAHGLKAGSIKTYNAGFSMLDVPSHHPMTSWNTIQTHDRGRIGMLDRWRKRLMSRDAYSRREDLFSGVTHAASGASVGGTGDAEVIGALATWQGNIAVPQTRRSIAADLSSETLEGEVLGSDEHQNTCGGSTVAKIAIGAAFVVAALSAGEPQKTRTQRRRRSGIRTHGRPMLPAWLVDLDQMRENTIVRDQDLAECEGNPDKLEGDAVVLLGHLVRRKVAVEAAMKIGNPALVDMALNKRSYRKHDRGWFVDAIVDIPKSAFSTEEAQRLAKLIDDELSDMPLWNPEKYRIAGHVLKIEIETAMGVHAQAINDRQQEITRAKEAVSWRSRRDPKPGYAHYSLVECRNSKEIARRKAALVAGRTALERLDVGDRSAARAFSARDWAVG
jgi:hypothetical protein